MFRNFDTEPLVPRPALNVWREAVSRQRNHQASATQNHAGDLGAYLDNLDLFYPISIWPPGMRLLFYKPYKKNVERFTLTWFLLSNGMPPGMVGDVVNMAQHGLEPRQVYHVNQLCRLYKEDPTRYRTHQMETYTMQPR